MQTPEPSGPSDASPSPKVDSAKSRRTWSWKKRIIVGALTAVVGFAAMMGGAEYYTAQPAFCRSCHIMEPYWQSWNHDLHSSKLGVRCVDCHYAPGERFTFHAKFKGLSQATSYFSGRAGGSRPRAKVNDASCTTSACHGDNKYLATKLLIGEIRSEKRNILGQETEVNRVPTVTFVHDKHLNVEPQRDANRSKLEEASARVKAALPAEVFASLEALSTSVQPFPARIEKLTAELTARGLQGSVPDATEMLRLADMGVRFEQLAGLNCAACHSYDASGQNHFAVDRQTCYTCHFTNQAFNHGTGQCLNCHVPPTRQILIHAAPATQGAKPSIMNHQDILDRKIDCTSCHLDVIQGQGRVSARECTHCHDQASYLERFESRTLKDVEEYHRVHVAAQRARCPDCHGATTHALIEPTMVATSAGFLKPIIENCQHCHPDHHTEQVELLMGVGGAGNEPAMPNAMFGSRLNCQACHQQSGEDFKGDPLIQATASTCIACHEQKYGDLLKQWLSEVSAYLTESEKALAQVKQRVEQRKAEGKPIPEKVAGLIEAAEQNIHLVKTGNGIHNRNFATHLLDVSDERLREAQQLLAE